MDETRPTSIRVESWSDPLVEAHGHDPRGAYVETFWTPLLGPTATLLLRRLATWLEAEPDGFDLDCAGAAAGLGVGHMGGKNSPFMRSLSRLEVFGVARWARVGGDTPRLYHVRTAMPTLNAARVRRLPDALATAHASAVPTADAQYRPSPTCRFARDAAVHPSALAHICTDKFGGPVRPGTECHHEARAQIRDAAAVGLVLDEVEVSAS